MKRLCDVIRVKKKRNNLEVNCVPRLEWNNKPGRDFLFIIALETVSMTKAVVALFTTQKETTLRANKSKTTHDWIYTKKVDRERRKR